MELISFWQVEIVLGVSTFLIVSYLGLLVFSHNYKSAANRLFFLLSLVIDTYIVTNYISLHPFGGPGAPQLFWIRVVMMVTSLLGALVLFLVHTFPGERFTMPRKYSIPVLALMLASVIISSTPLLFSRIDYPGGQPLPVFGPGVPIFFAAFPGLFIVSFIILIRKFRRATGHERERLKLFLVGIITTFSFMVIVSFFAVLFFKKSTTVFLGPLSSVILMIFMAYGIVKYQLFNIKVIATESLIGLLTIILITEGFLARSTSAVIFKTLFAGGVACIGYLLVKSVKKEIRQREELVLLTESLQKANTEMHAANVRLEELDRQKNEFLSIASHQLRTPLSIFNGYIELLEEGAYGKVEKNTVEALTNMDETNQRLVSLVDEFLDITRIEQGRTKFVFLAADLSKTIDSVVAELRHKLRGKDLSISWQKPDAPCLATVDEEKIRHVIFNFLDNAIKYSEHGVITVKIAPERSGYAISVTDLGLGFEEKDRVNFFQKFYRGKNVEGINVNGTGLGLYVCNKFIEAHGGRVWATSPGLGKGSEFGFWVPKDRASSTETANVKI